MTIRTVWSPFYSNPIIFNFLPLYYVYTPSWISPTLSRGAPLLNLLINLHIKQIHWETNLCSTRSRNCSRWPNQIRYIPQSTEILLLLTANDPPPLKKGVSKLWSHYTLEVPHRRVSEITYAMCNLVNFAGKILEKVNNIRNLSFVASYYTWVAKVLFTHVCGQRG
jgi:hypothetical protein